MFSFLQLKTYHEDFETERIAREKMAGKLEQVTGEVQQLREELKMKDQEVKRLHSHLNRSAANQMKAEMEMEVTRCLMFFLQLSL